MSQVVSHTTTEKFENQQSLVILDLFLRNTQEGKSHDYCDAIVFENQHLQTALV